MRAATKILTATTLTIALFSNASAHIDDIDRVACNFESAGVMGVYATILIYTKSGMDKEAAFSRLRTAYLSKETTHETRKMLMNTLNLVDSNYYQLKKMNAEQIKAFTFNQCVNNLNK